MDRVPRAFERRPAGRRRFSASTRVALVIGLVLATWVLMLAIGFVILALLT